ncbi:hypothetical protein CIP107578_00714 [Corynebacterium diphtheriae]|uniref:hypothetical protein n=1 Tax=Corynebacterium diphtheriae TaxID=1717 RepID=UPI0013C7B0EC|nr:hypothetical protein [Corynebacterium diphtheriae]UJL53390.1 hypothetical protein FE380_03860 [Corynebacterium diphtheriae]CAB0593143.1 hypothetical protein CIP107558_00712 [Corynebacterium diphtheriae]CAB0639175.1 hypothetical protein CIP107578_00714 [Corynebacterium diphtheriae]
MNESIVEARKNYFSAHPFNPKEKALLVTDENDIPVGFITLPDMGEMSVVAMKFGYEFLAHVRTDEDVDKWISAVLGQAQSADIAGIMFAHAFRGIAVILPSLIDKTPGLREVMEEIAADGWGKEF